MAEDTDFTEGELYNIYMALRYAVKNSLLGIDEDDLYPEVLLHDLRDHFESAYDAKVAERESI